MNLEHYSSEKLKDRLIKIANKYLGSEYRVFFFGSRVRGDNFSRADIDIGVVGPKKLAPTVKLDIEDELERLPILYKIDFVDFNNVSEDFKKGALRNIEYVR